MWRGALAVRSVRLGLVMIAYLLLSTLERNPEFQLRVSWVFLVGEI